jgi:hypothetical protein
MQILVRIFFCAWFPPTMKWILLKPPHCVRYHFTARHRYFCA